MTDSRLTRDEEGTFDNGRAPVTIEPLTEQDDRAHEVPAPGGPPEPEGERISTVQAAAPERLPMSEPEKSMTESAGRNSTSWSADQVVQAFKELVTAMLAMLLVGYTVFVAHATLGFVGDSQKMTEAKDVLLLMLGVAGMVVGYYFGCVPGDAQATQARKQAAAATTETEQVSAQAQQMAERVSGLSRRLAAMPAARRDAAGTLDPALAADLDDLESSAAQLSRSARARFE